MISNYLKLLLLTKTKVINLLEQQQNMSWIGNRNFPLNFSSIYNTCKSSMILGPMFHLPLLLQMQFLLHLCKIRRYIFVVNIKLKLTMFYFHFLFILQFKIWIIPNKYLKTKDKTHFKHLNGSSLLIWKLSSSHKLASLELSPKQSAAASIT